MTNSNQPNAEIAALRAHLGAMEEPIVMLKGDTVLLSDIAEFRLHKEVAGLRAMGAKPEASDHYDSLTRLVRVIEEDIALIDECWRAAFEAIGGSAGSEQSQAPKPGAKGF